MSSDAAERTRLERAGPPIDRLAAPQRALSTDAMPLRLSERYRVDALIARGGMGAVYRAYDELLDEPIALKTLRADLPQQAVLRERFRQEVKLARRVAHRNVARVFDIGVDRGLWFLTMELLDGVTLRDAVRGCGALPLPRALSIALPLVEALEAVHALGVVHRDLKPSNVMMLRDGRVILTDFGLAAREAHAGEAFVVGTPNYMAPEQSRPSAAIDHRADLFSLGVMLYELLAGRLPWSRRSRGGLHAPRASDPIDPFERDDVPEPLATLVEALLRADPSERPHAAADVVAVLRSLEGLSSPIELVRSSPPPTRVLVRPLVADGVVADWLLEGVSAALAEGLRRASGRFTVVTREPTDEESERVEPDVDVRLEGRLREEGSSLSLSLSLRSIGDDMTLWETTVVVADFDLQELVDRACVPLTHRLDERPRSSVERPRVTDRLRLQLLLEARFVLAHRWYEDTMPAVSLLERALAHRSDDPEALSELAMAYARASDLASSAEQQFERVTKAWSCVARATELAPRWPDAWAAAAMVAFQARAVDECLEHGRRALELEPNIAIAHELIGRVLAERGPLEESCAHLERALSLNDQLHRIWGELWRVYALMDRVEDARAAIAPLRRLHTQLPWFEVIHHRFDLWCQPERLRDKQPPSVHFFSPLWAPAIESCHRALKDGRQVDLEVVREAIGRIASQPFVTRRALLIGQNLIEHAAVSGVSFERGASLLDALLDAGLRDPMWLERAPVFKNWRRDPAFAPRIARARAPLATVSAQRAPA